MALGLQFSRLLRSKMFARCHKPPLLRADTAEAGHLRPALRAVPKAFVKHPLPEEGQHVSLGLQRAIVPAAHC